MAVRRLEVVLLELVAEMTFAHAEHRAARVCTPSARSSDVEDQSSLELGDALYERARLWLPSDGNSVTCIGRSAVWICAPRASTTRAGPGSRVRDVARIAY